MIGQNFFIVSYSLVLTAATLGASPVNTAGPNFTQPAATVSLDPLVNPAIPGKWRHGAFLYLQSGSGASSPGPFYTLGKDGNMISSVMPKIAGKFWIADSDRSAAGEIVYVGGSTSTSGQIAPFLAIISPNGTSRTMSTSPYQAHQVSVAPDGTIWTLGLEMINQDAWAAGLNPAAGVLRHFDELGQLLGSTGAQSQFKGHDQLNRLFAGFLVATKERVGWYSSIHGAGNYVEFSTQTMKPEEYPGLPKLSANGLVVGFALTESGKAFVSFEDHAVPTAPSATYHHRRVYMFDRSTSSWVPVQTPAIAGEQEPHLLAGQPSGAWSSLNRNSPSLRAVRCPAIP